MPISAQDFFRQIMRRDEPMPLTATDHFNVGAINVMLNIARSRVQRHEGNPQPYYKAAGLHLDMLRKGKSKAIWGELVRVHCGLGVSRAYELVRLAGGMPLAGLRAEAAARKARQRHGRKGARTKSQKD